MSSSYSGVTAEQHQAYMAGLVAIAERERRAYNSPEARAERAAEYQRYLEQCRERRRAQGGLRRRG